MLVRFWGVRGSTPTPQAENLRYGGNTSCVEVRIGRSVYVFDCGTGFRQLGRQLSREFAGQATLTHVFVSHFHWDHIQGIPFFLPLYERSENQLVFHAAARTRSLQRVMEEQMASPYFPVKMDEMKGQRSFDNIDEGRVQIDDEDVPTRIDERLSSFDRLIQHIGKQQRADLQFELLTAHSRDVQKIVEQVRHLSRLPVNDRMAPHHSRICGA